MAARRAEAKEAGGRYDDGDDFKGESSSSSSSSSSTPVRTNSDQLSSDASLQQWTQIDFAEVELGEKIGGGGVGVIYEGRYRGQPVALKTLFDPKVDDALMAEYMDELLVMSQLEHDNVVSFLGASMTPPNLCFVMELCDSSLFNMLHEQRAEFTTYERVQIAGDVAAAMEYLHSRSPAVIHRDLKSHNLLVSSRGIVKLCDFGLVKTRTTQAGTPAYMAPELLDGGSFNKSVDVYSFGVLLFELFAQEVPFAGYEIDDIRRAVTRGERPRIPSADTPEPVRDLMARCWAQEPSQRPSFPAIRREVEDLLRRTPESTELDALDYGGGGGGDALDDLLFSGK